MKMNFTCVPSLFTNFHWDLTPHYGKQSYLIWPGLPLQLHCEGSITCTPTPYDIEYPKLSYTGMPFTYSST